MFDMKSVVFRMQFYETVAFVVLVKNFSNEAPGEKLYVSQITYSELTAF